MPWTQRREKGRSRFVTRVLTDRVTGTMRRGAALLTTALLALSCSSSPPAISSGTPSPSASGSATASPSASPVSTGGGPLTGDYGLLLSAGTLELVKPDGSIGATVTVAVPSVQFCSAAHDGANVPPPVSASSDQVYFRDGDTKIRMVVPPSGATDVTTVPGGPTTISFFSVSPDDTRIAVVVEDLSSATTIKLKLYVEDLHGGGHHLNIFSSTQPKGKVGTTIWPMGWHQGSLILAIVTACSFEPAGLSPSEWHVSNPTTAVRLATIRQNNCVLSFWPSPAGVGCINPQGATTVYDWSGKATATTAPPSPAGGYTQTGLSPSGSSVFFATGAGIGASAPTTQILELGPGPYATLPGHSACAWIDEDHLLAPNAVIHFPAETPGNVRVTATATTLATSGVCAGRFPGGI
jgi:hypothetical protein